MKSLVFIVFSIGCLNASAQTAIIAHKSHSGTSVNFLTDPHTNFGIPSSRLVQVIRLNDSMSVEVSDHYNGYYSFDTVYKNPLYANYELNIDSVQKITGVNRFYHYVDYINFKHSPDSVKPKSPGLDGQKLIQAVPKEQQTIPPTIPPKKKKKSYLLFLFGITGGGLLIFRIFNRPITTRIA